MDRVDRMYKVKQFYMGLYRPCIEEGNNLKNNEYITVFQNDKNKVAQPLQHFNNIDDLVSFTVRKNNIYLNTYFNLTTTDGQARAKENLQKAYCLGFDFDKDKLGNNCNINYIQEQFKKNKLWYNALIGSGHGYHAYIFIEPTSDIDLVVEVSKKITELLGADMGATKPTQILRIPYTYNVKEEADKKLVTLIYLDKNTKRKDINKMANRLLKNGIENTENKKTEYVINNTNIPNCIIRILREGSLEGSRNSDLQKIIIALRLRNKSFETISNVVEEWNSKNSKKLSKNELEYQTKYIYDNLKYTDLGCKECKNKDNCWDRTVSSFDFPSDYKVFKLTETTTKYLKKSSRKGIKTMNGNQLLLYSILMCHSDGLYRDEIIKELSYKNKKLKIDRVALSKNTLTKTLKELEENSFISVETVDRKKLYKPKETRNKVELTYDISFGATFECVKGFISTEELRLYNYMRYLHNKEQRENPKALKGNILQVNQSDLAKALGVTQQRISKMIESLLNEKVISIWYRGQSKNNGFDYYVYRLNY